MIQFLFKITPPQNTPLLPRFSLKAICQGKDSIFASSPLTIRSSSVFSGILIFEDENVFIGIKDDMADLSKS